MSNSYAKVIVKGSPISKSNFKLFNMQGRAILPYNTGKYYDRYAIYEEEIAMETRSQNPGIVISESCIAILKVFYKSDKRHPDTNNITKSILDGIEKSGLIINDAQVRRLVIEEFYDKENPRFELELFGESTYSLNYSIEKTPTSETPIQYSSPPNRKSLEDKKHSTEDNSSITSKEYLKLIEKKAKKTKLTNKKEIVSEKIAKSLVCEICGRAISENSCISANKGKTLICKTCFKKMF